MRRLLSVLFLLPLLLACGPALAHKPSDSYLSLRVDGREVSGQWDIALRDLDNVIGLDADGDGQLTWDEVRSRHADIAAYALSRLSLSADGAACQLHAGAQMLDQHTDGSYTVLPLRVTCAPFASARADVPTSGERRTAAPITHIAIGYKLFADVDAQHRGLLRVEHDGATVTGILGGDRPELDLPLAQLPRWRLFGDYVRHGIWHIWIGFDHILFLVSLLLPAVLVRKADGWQAAQDFRSAGLDVLKIVTAFTLAHSITLSLAALGMVSLPSRWVESAIAASVAIAAANNLVPVVRGKRWLAAFIFGLVHGFGFASVLADLGLPRGSLAAALVGFNAGVEIGQLAIVAAVLPLAYALRATWLYRRVLFAGGSCAIVAVAAMWLGERLYQ
jgi:hypothetical protein